MKLLREQIVYDWQVGLLYRNGIFIEKKPAGKYRLKLYRNEELFTYDTRPTATLFNAGEVQSADKIGVTIFGSVRRKIVNPKKLIDASTDNESLIRDWAAATITQFAAQTKLDELLSSSEVLAKKLEAELSKRLKDLGIEVVETPTITMSLSRSVKRALELELLAKKRALADLEEARGKTAVLRHLANSAQLIKDNPALYKLLLSQKVRSLNIEMEEK